MNTIRTAIAAGLIITMSACSHITVIPKESSGDCTTHYTAPVADTALTAMGMLAVYGAAAAAGLGNNRMTGTDAIIILGIPTWAGVSTYYGYKHVSRCRQFNASKRRISPKVVTGGA